jgi:AP-1-like factor
MAGTTNDFQSGTPFYLDATQQDLLLAALASNKQNSNDLFSTNLESKPATLDNSQYQYPLDGVDPTFFTSPQQATPANAFGSVGMDDSPFVDYLDGDNSFDFDNADDDLMIGAPAGTARTRATSARVPTTTTTLTTMRAVGSAEKVKTNRPRSQAASL